jgi:hypothetical protein
MDQLTKPYPNLTLDMVSHTQQNYHRPMDQLAIHPNLL